jgi:hypothetical protein
MNGWLIEVIYLGNESDTRGIMEKWAASFDDPQAAVAAVVEKSRGMKAKAVRPLDAAELAGAGVTKIGEVAFFNATF